MFFLLLVGLMIVGVLIVLIVVCVGEMVFGFVDIIYRGLKWVCIRKLVENVVLILDVYENIFLNLI